MVDLVDTIPGASLKYAPEQVDAAYGQMADWATGIIRQSERPVMLIGPMQGALMATAALANRIQPRVSYSMVKVSLYDASNQAGESATFDYWPIKESYLTTFDFIVVDDVAESLRTFVAMKERLEVRGAKVYLTTLVDKPTNKRAANLRPDFSPLSANEDEWLVGEGMNSGDTIEGLAFRCVRGVWVMDR